MTKSKAYYQAYLVLDCLSDEEYSLIPQELLDDIKSKMEVDPTIKIDSSIPLEKQKIDEKAYDVLEKVIKAIERNYGKDAIDNPNKYATNVKKRKKNDDDEVSIGEESSRKKPTPKPTLEVERESSTVQERRFKELQTENLKLQGIIKALEEENKKIEKARELFVDYKEVLTLKDVRIKKLSDEVDELKKSNAELNSYIQKVPKVLRKIFIRDYQKTLPIPSNSEGVVIKIDESK